MALSDQSKRRLAEIMRAKLRRVCANTDLCESISDDELIRQAEEEHERQVGAYRARTLSLAVKSAVAATPPTRRTPWR